MPSNDQSRAIIQQWLDSALIQVAAESYFQNIQLSDTAQVVERLENGNTPLDLGNNLRYIRFAPGGSTSQAQEFLSKYDIVDHYADDATGFSATVLRDKATGVLMLSFRSTEYANPEPGKLAGDYDRDGYAWPNIDNGTLRVDGEVANRGFAFGQILAMERYYERLKQGITAVDPNNTAVLNDSATVNTAVRDAALAASRGLTSWALTNALLAFHLSGADGAALGGDLAYQYGNRDALTGIGLTAALDALSSANFGAQAQALRPFSGLQEGLVKLS